MDRRVLDPSLAFNQIRHAPRRPQARAVPEGFGTTEQPALDALPVRRGQLRRPPGARGALQSLATARGQLLDPATDRLAMDAHAPGHFRGGDPLLEQPSRPKASPFQFLAILFHPGWMSHARQYSAVVAECHYVM